MQNIIIMLGKNNELKRRELEMKRKENILSISRELYELDEISKEKHIENLASVLNYLTDIES